jgi:poly(3-hydroxybutyrate) depolymerase
MKALTVMGGRFENNRVTGMGNGGAFTAMLLYSRNPMFTSPARILSAIAPILAGGYRHPGLQG